MSDKLKNILAENMRRFNTKNLSEQTRNNPAAHKALELMLISKFVDLGNAGIEYKDPGMRQQFLNDYENEYSAWLTRNGFTSDDMIIDQNNAARVSNLMKQKNASKNWKK